MAKSLSRANNEIADIYLRHVDTVYRVCLTCLRNPASAEDAVSETFLNLMKSGQAFESEEHEKAWLIRAATNVCKNVLKHWWLKNENIDDYAETLGTEQAFATDPVIDIVFGLPEKYRIVIYLYYFEGYSGKEISQITGKPHATIRYHLHEARKILKEKLGEEFR